MSGAKHVTAAATTGGARLGGPESIVAPSNNFLQSRPRSLFLSFSLSLLLILYHRTTFTVVAFAALCAPQANIAAG